MPGGLVLMMSFLALDGLAQSASVGGESVGTTATGKEHLLPAISFCARALPYVETDVTDSTDLAVQMVLNGITEYIKHLPGTIM